MKRYIKSSIRIPANYSGLPVEFADFGATVLTESRLDTLLDDLSSIVHKYVSQSFVEEYGLYLEVYVTCVDELTDSPDRVQCTLHSHLISSKAIPLGRGKEITNSPYCVIFYYPDADDSDYSSKIAKFADAVPKFVQFVRSGVRKLSTFENIGYPVPVINAGARLTYWVVKEHLGDAHTLDEARTYVLSRTYENRRSNYFGDDDIRDDVEVLISYASKHRWSCSDLIAFSKSCSEYARRRPE